MANLMNWLTQKDTVLSYGKIKSDKFMSKQLKFEETDSTYMLAGFLPQQCFAYVFFI